MKTLKKALALLVALAMSLSLMSVAAFADDEIIDEPATVEEPAAEEITAVEEAVAEAAATASEALETLASLTTDDAAPAEEVDASAEAIEAATAENDLDALSAIVEAAAESAKADAETAAAAAEKTQTASETLTQQIEEGTFESVADETVYEAVDEESGEVYETTSGQVLVETAQAAANAAVAAAQNAETASENAANAADAAQYALENADEPATEEQQQVVDTAKEAAADAADKAETAKAAAAEVEAVIETATATAEEAAEIVAKAADAAKDAAAAANNAAVAAKDAADTISVIRNVDETYTEDEVSAAKSVVVEKVEKAVELAKVADEKAAIAKEAAERAKDVTLSGEEKAQAIKEAAAAAQEATVAANEAADAASEAAEAAYSLAEHKGWPFYSKVVTAKGVIVTARAQAGVFPKGTELTVADMTAEQAAEQMDVAARDVVTAVDINFWFEGRKIQPDTSVGLVDVTIQDPNAEAVPTAVKTVKDGVTETLAVEVEDGVAKFEAEHFTTYATVEDSSVASFTNASDELMYADTLKEAINGAKAGTTVTLLKDVTLSDRVSINGTVDSPEDKAITLNMNNHNISGTGRLTLCGGSLTITGTGTISTTGSGLAPVEVRYTGSPESKRTLVIGDDVTLDGTGSGYGLNIFGTNNATANKIDVTVNGTVKSVIFVLGNLTNTGNEINITVNGKVESTETGIALNGYANVTVAGSVKGTTGVEVRAGKLTVTDGGQITATGTPTSVSPNGSGTTSTGAGIAVSQHTTKLPINVEIKGGTINGYSAFYESNPQGNSADDLAKITLNITGGTFNTTGDGTVAVYSQDKTSFITGGTFSDLSAVRYAASGANIKLSKDVSLSAAYAIDGNSNYGLGIDKSITLDGNNHTINSLAVRAIGIKGASSDSKVDVTIKNLIVQNENTAGCGIFTRGNLNSLTLDNVQLVMKSTSGYNQPLTISGNANTAETNNNATVSIKGCTFQSAPNCEVGYAIINWVPANIGITGSTIKGWACLYAKPNSNGTSYTIDNSSLISANHNAGATNAFGVLVTEDKNVTMSVTNTNIDVSGDSNTQSIAVFNTNYAYASDNSCEGCVVTLGAGNTVVMLKDASFSYHDKVADNTEKGGRLVIIGGTFDKNPSAYVPDGYTAHANSNGTYTVRSGDGHAWSVSYAWSADNRTVTATRACADNAAHNEIETVVTTVSTTPATYSAAGSTVYTATFANSAFSTQTRTVTIPQLVYEDSSDDSDDDTPVTTTPQQTTTIEEEATPLAALPENLAEVTVAMVDAETGETVEVAVSELPNVFVDVAEDSYARGAIAYAAALGLMNGVGSNADGEATFAPTAATTGDMLATILYRATSGETTSGENWAEAATAWAADNNLAEGMGIESLSQLEVVSREQMVTVMYRVAEARGFDVSFANDLVKFNDADELSDYARVAMEWAVSVGLIKGTSKTTLSPTDDVTREQIALILMRFNELTKDVV